MIQMHCRFWDDEKKCWMSVPILVTPVPELEAGEKTKKWWKDEIGRIRRTYELAANVIIISSNGS